MASSLRLLILPISTMTTGAILQSVSEINIDLDIVEIESLQDQRLKDLKPDIVLIACQQSTSEIIPYIQALNEYFPATALILFAQEYHIAAAEYCLQLPLGHYLTADRIALLPLLLQQIATQESLIVVHGNLIQKQDQVPYQSDEGNHQFQKKLKILHEVSLTLATAESFDDLCKQAVILGREHLGFVRLSLWFVDDNVPDSMLGSFGIDEAGNIRDERGICLPLYPGGEFEAMLQNKVALSTRDNASLYNHLGEEVGRGWLGTATLWDGTRGIGWINADYLNASSPPPRQQGELLRLYGLTLGYLCTQIRIQVGLQEQLKVLHDVSLTLSTTDDFDDFCQKAVQLGRDRLGFERLGLWFVDDTSPDSMLGSFGIDEHGKIRDERGVHSSSEGVFQEMAQEKIALRTWDNAPLYNHLGVEVGQGWISVATLWDGNNVIGWINADNFLGKSVPTKQDGELLKLYGLTLGHLCTQKRIQSVLKDNERYLKQAESIAHLGNFSFDLQTQKITWSDEIYHIFGQEIGTEITFEHYQRLLPPDDFARIMASVEQTIESKQAYHIEHELVLDDGRQKHIFAIGRPILDSAGDVVKIFGIVQDISERKHAEQQKIEFKLNKQKFDFLRDFVEHMTHDLKTPLATLKASSYILRKTKDPVKQQIQLERLDYQVNQLQKMIGDILTVARLDHLPESTFSKIQLNHLIEAIEQELHSKAQQKGIKLELELTRHLPLVTAIPDDIRRALLNLVENALNYTSEGGLITVRTYTENSHIICEIEDTGIGISEADLPHVFERFYRAGNARSFDAGTGLGLAIVNKIIQLHDGEINIHSHLGKGTTFTVKL